MKNFLVAIFVSFFVIVAAGVPVSAEVRTARSAGFDLPAAAAIVPRGEVKTGGFLAPVAPAPKQLPSVRVGIFEQNEWPAVKKPSKEVRTCVFKPESTDGCAPVALTKGDAII